MAEHAEGDGAGLGLEGLVLEGYGVDVLAGGLAGCLGDVLDGCLFGLLLHMAGVAPADALGGAVPLAVLLAPGVLGCVPVVADGVEGFGLGLRLKALVLEGRGVDPLARLGAVGRVRVGCLYGLLNRPTAVAALGVAGTIPAVVLLLPNVVLLIDEIIFMLAVGVAVGLHLAAGPHELAVDVDVSFALVVGACLATKAKELRAGSVIARSRGRAVGDVEDVLFVSHIIVVDGQCLLTQERIRVERAVIHVDGDVVLGRAEIGVDINRLAAGIEGAVVERHGRRAVRPDGVIEARSVKRRVRELGGLVAPVERLAIDDATVEHSLVGANEAEVVGTAGTHRHVLEGNGAGSVEGVVAVVLSAEVRRIWHERANVPRGLFGSLAHKGEILALGGACGVHLIERIVALTKHKGVSTGRLFGGDGDVCVDGTGPLIGDGPCRAICKCW